MAKTNFFEYLDFLLQFAPARPEEREIREKLAKIGVGPGKTFDFKDLSPEHKAEIVLGMKEAKKVEQVLKDGKNTSTGGRWLLFGDRAFFHGNWLLRAAGAIGGIYGNDAVEATYPPPRPCRRRNARRQQEQLHAHLSRRAFPPVNAFWSVTMYDGKTQLLIRNPIDRYLINSPMLPNLKTFA